MLKFKAVAKDASVFIGFHLDEWIDDFATAFSAFQACDKMESSSSFF